MRWICLIVLIAIVLPFNPAHAEEQCLSCHNPEGGATDVNLVPYNKSIHVMEGISCSDCHVLAQGEDHSDGKGMLTVDCSGCHDQENLHGEDALDKTRPQCRDCHTNHSIMGKDDPRSSVHPDNLESTCQRCHASEYDRQSFLLWLPSLRISTHGKEDFSNEYSSKNCIGCHQGMAVHGKTEIINNEECNKCHLSEKGELIGIFHAFPEKRNRPIFITSVVLNQVLLWALVIGGIGYFARLFSNRRKGKGTG